MPADQLQVSVTPGRTVSQRIIECSGPLTMPTLTPLRDAIKAETSPVLILALNEVSHMDSAGLGLLVQLQATCARTGRRLALVEVNDRVRKTLGVTGLDHVLTLYSTRSDAEQALA